LFGIELHADVSLLLIFALIVTNLGLGAFSVLHPDWSSLTVWGTSIAAALLFFVSIAAHELSHALVGRRFGIPVRRITLFVFGGMAHAESEPPSPRAEFWMAIAGPVASVVIAFGTALLASALLGDVSAHAGDPLSVMRSAGPFTSMLLWLAPVNLVLALFNSIPGFPLDGGRVLRAILWWWSSSLEKATLWSARVGQLFAWSMMAFGALSLLSALLPETDGRSLQGLWFILIGWFLNNAARSSLAQVLVQQTLSQVQVREVMHSHVDTVSPELSVRELLYGRSLRADREALPVVYEDQVVGIVRLAEARRVPKDRWDDVFVHEIMTPEEAMHSVRPDDDAMRALRELADQDPVPVIEDRHLVGVTRREDILNWLALHPPKVV
jgi:Zn-dependent protease/predicted transcriptional regulator